jgi:hypothetical protein
MVNMANDQTVVPVIIKRKKIIAADGHHGGAWKVVKRLHRKMLLRFVKY